jgi:beta-lactamase regulating signal transducer with metallopeptidase domain
MATALAIVVASIGLVCRRPAVMHALWLLVLIKFITPPLFNIPIAIPEEKLLAVAPWKMESSRSAVPVPVDRADSADDEPLWFEDGESLLTLADLPPGEAGEDPCRIETPATPANETEHDNLGCMAAAGKDSPSIQVEETVPPFTAKSALEVGDSQGLSSLAFEAIPWLSLCGALWLAGSVCWFGFTLLQVLRFHRLLRCARPASADLRIQAQRLAFDLGLSRCPSVWLVPGRLSPMVWTIGAGPRLLIPAGLWNSLSDKQREALLVHELAHLKRRDHWVRGLEILVNGLYWWHPVVGWACRQLREAEEQCCDAWVVWTLPGLARDYATALVETVDFVSETPAVLPAVASGIGPVHDLRRRLTMIMRGTTPRKLSGAGLVTMLGLGAFLLPMLPSRAQQPRFDEQRVERDEDEKAQKRDRDREQAEREKQAAERAEQQAKEQEGRAEQQRRDAELRSAEQQLNRAKSEVERFASRVQRMQQELESANKRLVEAKKQLENRQKQLARRAEEARSRAATSSRTSTTETRSEERRSEPRTPEPPRRAGRAASGDQEQRLRDVERKLDSLLREIQTLRRDMRRPRSGGGGDESDEGALAPEIPVPPQTPHLAPRNTPRAPSAPAAGVARTAPAVPALAPLSPTAPTALPALPTTPKPPVPPERDDDDDD